QSLVVIPDSGTAETQNFGRNLMKKREKKNLESDAALRARDLSPTGDFFSPSEEKERLPAWTSKMADLGTFAGGSEGYSFLKKRDKKKREKSRDTCSSPVPRAIHRPRVILCRQASFFARGEGARKEKGTPRAGTRRCIFFPRKNEATPCLPQLLLPAPPSNGAGTTSAKVDPNMDLLSGEDYDKPTTENLLALVPVSEPLNNSASNQNALALADMFSPNNSTNNNKNPANSFDSNSTFPTQQTYPAVSNLQLQAQQTQQPQLFPNGGIPNSGAPQFEQSSHDQGMQLNMASTPWNGQFAPAYNPQQQALGYALPPPPWEAQPAQSEMPGLQHQPLQTDQLSVHPLSVQTGQLGGIQAQPMLGSQLGGMQPQQMSGGQLVGMPPQHMMGPQLTGLQPQVVQGGQFVGMYPPMQNSQMRAMYPPQMFGGHMVGMGQQPMQGGQLTGYGYGPEPGAQFYDPMRPTYPYYTPNALGQRTYGLSVQDNNTYANEASSYQMPTSSSYLQNSNKPSKPEDKLFGDLVSLAKNKAK
ncbi:hypothetical protein BHE74_00007825, partial [Ensete ventricosum]